jgi:hypothetical protein
MRGTMKRHRKLIAACGAAMLAVASLATIAIAQAPPDPPAVYYGSATGATAGQSVASLVSTGGTRTTCGGGVVMNEGGPVYTAQVLAASQQAGCGQSGRTVQFYLSAVGDVGGRLSVETDPWPGAATAKQKNLTFAAPFEHLRRIPMVAKDGIQQ